MLWIVSKMKWNNNVKVFTKKENAYGTVPVYNAITILEETISSKFFHRRYLRVINGITEFMPACLTTTYLSSLG